MRRTFLLTVSLFLFAIAAVFGQSRTLSPNSSVSVITCGLGNEVYSLFGHTAIRISDPELQLDVVYNYGAFDFNTPNFIGKFTKGDLQYFVTAGTFADFLEQYTYEQRSVSEQDLNLSLAEKQKLFDKLNSVLFSDAKYYTYKFIDRNCTSMVTDILNETLGGKIIVKTGDKEQTYREILFPFFNGHFYEQLGTSIIFGTKVDRKGEKIFLPSDLENSLAATQYNGKLLAKPKTVILNYPLEKPFSWWNNIYTYLLLLAFVVIANRKPLTVFYLILVAGIGLFFSVAGWYSLHAELANNYNVLLFNPLLFLLLFFIWWKNQKAIRYVSVFCLACIGIYLVAIANKPYLWIVLPAIAANSIILFLILRQNKKISDK